MPSLSRVRTVTGSVLYAVLLVGGAAVFPVIAVSSPAGDDAESEAVLRGGLVVSAIVGAMLAHRQSRDQLGDLRRDPFGALFDEGWLVALVSAMMTVFVAVGGGLVLAGGYFAMRALGDLVG